MRKKIMVLLTTLLFFGSALSAKTDYFDLGVTVGSRSHFFERGYDTSKLSLQYGLTMGLSDVYELDITATSQLVPSFFGDTSAQVLIQRSLLGFRNSGTEIAGMGFNMLLGAGVGFSTYNPYAKFSLTHLLVSFTPAVAGSPSLCKRERLLTFTLGINIYTQQVSLYLDILTDDFYFLGTYKDHQR